MKNKPTKRELGRIELLEKVRKDTNKIRVKDVELIFTMLLTTYFENTKSGKAIKNKITEDEFVRFFTGFVNSFLSTIYINASKNDEEFEERLAYVNKINEDVLVAVTEIKPTKTNKGEKK